MDDYAQCWLCGRNGNGDPLERHHIFAGSNRKKSEKYGLVVLLCGERCHRNGKNAAHKSKDTMQTLHEYGQRKAMEENGWSVDDFRREFGKSYIQEDEQE